MEKSLNEDTYEKLKYDIMNFKLVPGDSISAQKIAVRYNVSRTPAREAIVNLEKEGLLKIIPQSDILQPTNRINDCQSKSCRTFFFGTLIKPLKYRKKTLTYRKTSPYNKTAHIK